MRKLVLLLIPVYLTQIAATDFLRRSNFKGEDHGVSWEARSLWYAVHHDQFHVVQELLNPWNVNSFVSPESSDTHWYPFSTPLHVAAVHNNIDIARLLIHNMANLDAQNIRGETPLCMAVAYDARDVVELLLEYSAQTYIAGSSVLHRAVQDNALGMCELLIERGVSVDTQDSQGRTPLHLAASLGHRVGKQIISLLAEKGAQFHVQDHNGMTPWHLLVTCQNLYFPTHIERVHLFVMYGAEPDISDVRQHVDTFTQALCDTLSQCVRHGVMTVYSSHELVNRPLELIKVCLGHGCYQSAQAVLENVSSNQPFYRAEIALHAMILEMRLALSGNTEQLRRFREKLLADDNALQALSHMLFAYVERGHISASLLVYISQQYADVIAHLSSVSQKGVHSSAAGRTLLHVMADNAFAAGAYATLTQAMRVLSKKLVSKICGDNEHTPMRIAQMHRDQAQANSDTRKMYQYDRFIRAYQDVVTSKEPRHMAYDTLKQEQCSRVFSDVSIHVYGPDQ